MQVTRGTTAVRTPLQLCGPCLCHRRLNSVNGRSAQCHILDGMHWRACGSTPTHGRHSPRCTRHYESTNGATRHHLPAFGHSLVIANQQCRRSFCTTVPAVFWCKDINTCVRANVSTNWQLIALISGDQTGPARISGICIVRMCKLIN